jgi:hypothetical protein
VYRLKTHLSLVRGSVHLILVSFILCLSIFIVLFLAFHFILFLHGGNFVTNWATISSKRTSLYGNS